MNRQTKIYMILPVALLLLFCLSVVWGSTGFSLSLFKEQNPLLHLRLSETITAMVVGGGIGVSGLLLQTLFKNPLAGPSVLGVSSGATLGVAMGIGLAGFMPFLVTKLSITLLGVLGALAIVFILIMANKYVKNSNTLLIIGLMSSYFTSAVVNIISFYTNKSSLQELVFWGLGSFSKEINYEIISLYTILVLGLVGACFFLINKLDLLLLGNEYAQAMGVKVKKTRFIIILIAGLLIGITTAWCGPIAFLGIAVPHLARNVFKTSKHFPVLCGTLLIGALLAVACNLIARLPGLDQVIPLNAVTSFVGAPVVVAIIFKHKLI